MSKILVVSYFAKRQGCCPAEWLDDKVDSLLKLGHEVVLVSSLWSEKFNHPKVKHYRVPSLSPLDYKAEVDEIKLTRKVPFNTIFWFPLIFLIGYPLDLMQKVLTNGLGGGKWSWTFSSFISCFYILLTKKIDLVFTTGGPASAHLSGVVAGKLFLKKTISEFQDPLSGEGIGRNSKSAQMLFALERFLVKKSDKVVYVTHAAADESKGKFGTIGNISSVYPGAKKFELSPYEKVDKKLKIVHLGTLYSTRNLDTLLEAIDLLLNEEKINEDDIEIVNLGDIYGEYREVYLKRNFIKQMSIMPREQAVNFAHQNDVCLLVQHNDPRSSTTIPYKTYDYLNLGKPIFALTNSEELDQLLTELGHFCAPVSNPRAIADKLYELVQARENLSEIKLKGLDAIKQTDELISLSN